MPSVNIKNPAIKRIHADLRELMKDPSDQYHAAPLESNLFEWHFTLRGPPDTEFEGGVYHGRILLPPEYPFKPPDIVFMTPNGRFNVGTKICLTISSYHPEFWQPAWGIRLILEALISFFPSPVMGAYGGLEWSEKERKRLAVASNEWKCYKCGHAKVLLPELKSKSKEGGGGGNGAGEGSNRYADQIKKLHTLTAKTAAEIAAESGGKRGAASDDGVAARGAPAVPAREFAARDRTSENLLDTPAVTEKGSAASSGSRDIKTKAEPTLAPVDQPQTQRGGAPDVCPDGKVPGASPSSNSAAVTPTGNPANIGAVGSIGRAGRANEAARKKHEKEDDMLTYLAVAIAMAIAGIVLRKFLRVIAP